MRWKAAATKISCAKIPASSHSAWVWPWSSELAAGWAECDPTDGTERISSSRASLTRIIARCAALQTGPGFVQ
eukprot:scaffold140940_cov142-Phaeocystis_antarctica.AAC.1